MTKPTSKAKPRPDAAEQVVVIEYKTTELHHDIAVHTESFVEEITGPTIRKSAVVDSLLDLRNLSQGRDLGLELTVDGMLEDMPGSSNVSSEWWMGCLSQLADHAAFLAAGYPAVVPEALTAA